MPFKSATYSVEQICGFYFEYLLTFNIFQRLNNSESQIIFTQPWRAFEAKLDIFLNHTCANMPEDIYHLHAIKSSIIRHYSSIENISKMLETVEHYASSASVCLELHEIPKGSELEIIKTEYAILTIIMNGFINDNKPDMPLVHGKMAQYYNDVFEFKGPSKDTAYDRADFLLAYTFSGILYLYIYEYKTKDIKTHFYIQNTSSEHFDNLSSGFDIRHLSPTTNITGINNHQFIYSTPFNNNKHQTLKYFMSFFEAWVKYSSNRNNVKSITYNAKIITNNTYFTWLDNIQVASNITQKLKPLLNHLAKEKSLRQSNFRSYPGLVFKSLTESIKNLATKRNLTFSITGAIPNKLHTNYTNIVIPIENQLNHGLIDSHSVDLMKALKLNIVSFAIGTMGIGKSHTYKSFISSLDSCLSIVSTKLTGINKDYLIHKYDCPVTVINTDSKALKNGIIFTNSESLGKKSFLVNDSVKLTFEYVNELTFDEKTVVYNNDVFHKNTGSGSIVLDKLHDLDSNYLGVNNSLIRAVEFINSLNSHSNICVVTSLAAIESSSGFSGFISKLPTTLFNKFTLFIDEFTTASSFTTLYDSALSSISQNQDLANKSTILFADASITDIDSLKSELSTPIHNGNIHASHASSTPGLSVIPSSSIRCDWRDTTVRLKEIAIVNRNGYPASSINLRFHYFYNSNDVSTTKSKENKINFYANLAIEKYQATKAPVFIYYQDKKVLMDIYEALVPKLEKLLKRNLSADDIKFYNSNVKFDPTKSTNYLFVLATSSGSRGISFKPIRNYILTIDKNMNFASELSEVMQASCRGRGYDKDISNREVSINIVILASQKHKNRTYSESNDTFHLPYFASTSLIAYHSILSRFTTPLTGDLQLCTTTAQGMTELSLNESSVACLFSNMFSALSHQTYQETIFSKLVTVYSPRQASAGGNNLEHLIINIVQYLHNNHIELMEQYLNDIIQKHSHDIAFISGYLFCNSTGSVSFEKINDGNDTNQQLLGGANYLKQYYEKQLKDRDTNANIDLHKALYTLSTENNFRYSEKHMIHDDNYILMIPIEYHEKNIHFAMKQFLEKQLSIPPNLMFPLTDSQIKLDAFDNSQPFIVFKGTTIENIKNIFTKTTHESIEKIFSIF